MLLLSLVLACTDAGWIKHCEISSDVLHDGGSVILCDLPVYAKRFASNSSPHKDNHYFAPNAPIPLFATIGTENGDWDFADTSGVNEVHGFVEPGAGSGAGRGGVEIYCNNLDGGYVTWPSTNSCVKYGNGPTSTAIAWWAGNGSFFSMGGDMTYSGDDNEKHINARTTRPGFASRLQLAGSDPSGGPSVYVQKTPESPGDPFQVIADGVASGFTSSSGIRAGKVNSLPQCNSYNEGVIIYDFSQKCFTGCDGVSWKCFLGE